MKKLTQDQFIEKAKLIHGNKYDYSLVKYKSIHEGINIICKEHGVFIQLPSNHYRGKGCPKCGGTHKLNNDDFINKSIKIHGDKYDYSLVNYIATEIDVKIICKEHGYFTQKPYNHLCGSGCPICGGRLKLTKEEFIKRAFEKHGDKYDYSLVEYKNIETNIEIICKIHGIFKQRPDCHVNRGFGCSYCNNKSVGEITISSILNKLKIKYEIQFKYKDCKNINCLPFDFYLEEHNILIEYDGIQHFEEIIFFEGKDGFLRTQLNDEIKNKYAKLNKIPLLRISYLEKDIEKIICNFIKIHNTSNCGNP